MCNKYGSRQAAYTIIRLVCVVDDYANTNSYRTRRMHLRGWDLRTRSDKYIKLGNL